MLSAPPTHKPKPTTQCVCATRAWRPQLRAAAYQNSGARTEGALPSNQRINGARQYRKHTRRNR
eukprot:5156286-Lingulodinium_polyedra.AAC.1